MYAAAVAMTTRTAHPTRRSTGQWRDRNQSRTRCSLSCPRHREMVARCMSSDRSILGRFDVSVLLPVIAARRGSSRPDRPPRPRSLLSGPSRAWPGCARRAPRPSSARSGVPRRSGRWCVPRRPAGRPRIRAPSGAPRFRRRIHRGGDRRGSRRQRRGVPANRAGPPCPVRCAPRAGLRPAGSSAGGNGPGRSGPRSPPRSSRDRPRRRPPPRVHSEPDRSPRRR
jgi:hypothetical protein